MNGSVVWRIASVAFAGGFAVYAFGSWRQGLKQCPAVASEPAKEVSQPSPTAPVRFDSHAPVENDGSEQLVQAKATIQQLEAQRKELQTKLRAVEADLRKEQGPPPYIYALSKAQWKDLAASGSIKYRIPCTSARYKLTGSDLDNLGLSADDGATVNAAFEASKERTLSTVMPACTKIVSQDIADMLGFDGCLNLLEKSISKTEPLASYDAHVAVDTARADGTPLPPNASTLAQLYYQLTGEGDQFQAELSKSFGPDEAERIWHAFPCARTVN